MSALFDRLSALFHENAHVGIAGMRDDTDIAPGILRPAAVLMAVTCLLYTSPSPRD